VRCYLLRNTTSGQLVAQSADATCHGGLQSPTDGYLTFNMTAAEARQAHAFTVSLSEDTWSRGGLNKKFQLLGCSKVFYEDLSITIGCSSTVVYLKCFWYLFNTP
jgi:hypothetical protein